MSACDITKNAICLCVDRGMAIPAIFVASSIRNFSETPKNDYDLIILTPPGELDHESREFIESRGIEIDESIPLGSIEDIRISQNRLSHTTLLRLFLADRYRDKYDKILYLDADLTIHDDVSRLFSIEMGLHAVAAVPSGRVLSDMSDREADGIRAHFSALGMKPPYRFFNSGVMLIDPHNWMEGRITERALHFIRRHPDLCTLPDEDALNAVLDGQILELSPIWNMRPERLWANNVDPVIIHYAGPNKPWRRFDRYDKLAAHRTAYAQYRQFLRETPWLTFLDTQWGRRDLLESFLLEARNLIPRTIAKFSRKGNRRRRTFISEIRKFNETTSFVDIEQGIAFRRGDFIFCSTD